MVTDITIDDDLMLIEIDAAEETWQNIYAYEMYWLFTEEGIQELGQSITSPDPANYLMDSTVLTIKNISGSATTITGGWGRDPSTNDTMDIIDTSGDPIFTNPPHVVAYGASGSGGATAAEIADAVWDETKSSHTTAGTFGKSLQDTESNSDATQAKVDLL